jgi:hypothetical protein
LRNTRFLQVVVNRRKNIRLGPKFLTGVCRFGQIGNVGAARDTTRLSQNFPLKMPSRLLADERHAGSNRELSPEEPVPPV